MPRLTVQILVGLAILGVVSFWFVPPIAQPQWYHDFGDKRSLLGIPNFWNVISNLPFLFVGGWGIGYLLPDGAKAGLPDFVERWLFLFLFAAVALTGVGSAYYHWEPNNDRLVWDRLPLAMMFMALFAIITVYATGRARCRHGVLLASHGIMGQGRSATLFTGPALSRRSHTHSSLAWSGNIHADRESLYRHRVVCGSQTVRVSG